MYYTYVVQSEEGYRYTGQTDDIENRLNAHNNRVSKWTRRGTNWKVIYMEKYQSRKDAQEREKFLKTGKGREFLNKALQ